MEFLKFLSVYIIKQNTRRSKIVKSSQLDLHYKRYSMPIEPLNDFVRFHINYYGPTYRYTPNIYKETAGDK